MRYLLKASGVHFSVLRILQTCYTFLRNRLLICDHLQLVCKHIISLPLQILCYFKGIGYFHWYLSALRCMLNSKHLVPTKDEMELPFVEVESNVFVRYLRQCFRRRVTRGGNN